jgi:hypothetical protein
MAEIDTFNKFFVAVALGGKIVILRPPRRAMSIDDALALAAWIVAASSDKKRFDTIYEAVCNT